MYLERRDSKHQCSYFPPQLLIVGSISRTSLIVRSEWLANDITCDFTNRSQLSNFGEGNTNAILPQKMYSKSGKPEF